MLNLRRLRAALRLPIDQRHSGCVSPHRQCPRLEPWTSKAITAAVAPPALPQRRNLPSALLVLGVVLHAGMSYMRQLRAMASEGGAEAYTLRLALLASLSAAAAQSLVDGVIVMPYSQTLLAVLCGWALAIHHSSASLIHPNDLRAERMGVAIVLLSAALLVWGIFPEIRDIVSSAGAFNTHVIQEGLILKPRFWSRGWIYE